MSDRGSRDSTSLRPERSAPGLELSEAALRLATEAMEVGIWDLDLVTGVLTCSDRNRAMFGIPPGEACTMADLLACLHAEDALAVKAAFAAATAPDQRAAFDIEYRTVGRVDGVVRWVAARGRGLFEAGRCIRAIGTTIDVTAAMLAKAELQASEARFRAAVDAVQGIVWTTDAAGDVTREQPAWAALTGQAFTAYRGVGWADAIHPDDRAGTLEAWRAAVAERRAFVSEHRVGRHDGAWRHFSVRAIPSFAADGALREWVCVYIDVTARTAAETERARLAASVEQSRDFIGVTNTQGIVLFINEAGRRLLGLGELQAIRGACILDCFAPEQRDFLYRTVFPALAPGGPWEGELLLRHAATAADIPVLCSVYPIRNAAEAMVGYGVLTRDLSERRAAEDALRQVNESLESQVAERTAQLRASEARLRAVFQTSHQLQGLLAPDGMLLDANATSLAVIGSSLGGVLGRPFWDTPWFTGTPGAPEMVRSAVASASAGQDWRQEITLHLPGGPRIYDFTVRPIRGRDGMVVAMLPESVDITEQRISEEALRQAQKMEAVGQLTGGIAHDFNNLLQAISGGLEIIGRKHVQSDEANALLRLVGDAVERGARLTRQLLAFARKQQLAARPTNVNASISECGLLLEHALTSDIEIERRLDAAVWAAMIDPNQLDAAILNLVLNARDAMPDGGVITLSTANFHAPGPGVPAELAVGDYVRVSVADTGAGMSAETLARVFEPFYTTKGIGKGTGLGLSQVHGFAHQSGGAVRLLSAPGAGTTVELYLPRAVPAPPVLVQA